MSDYPQYPADGRLGGRVPAALLATLTGLALAVAGFVLTSARGTSAGTDPPRVSVERILPADVLFHVEISNPSELGERLSTSRWNRLLDDPALSSIRERCEQHRQLLSDELAMATGLTLDELQGVPGPISVSMVATETGLQTMVTCIQFSNRDPRIDRVLYSIRSRFAAQTVSEVAIDVQGTTVFTLKVAGDAETAPVSWFVRDSVLVLGSDVDLVAGIASRWTAPAARCLADNSTYASIQSRTSDTNREPLLRWFADTAEVGRLWGGSGTVGSEEHAPQYALVRRLFNLDAEVGAVLGTGGTIDIASGDLDLIVRAAIECPEPLSGLMRMVTFPATEQVPPDWVPDDATFVTWNWDFTAAQNAFDDELSAIYGEGALSRFLYGFDQPFRNSSGRNLISETVGQFTGEGQLVRFRKPGELVLAFGVKDADVMRDLLDTATRLPTFPFLPHAGSAGTVYETPAVLSTHPSAGGLAVVGQYLVWSSSLARVQQIADGVPASHPLRDSRGYQSLTQRIPVQTSIAAFNHSDQYVELLCRLMLFGPESSVEADDADILSEAVTRHRSPFCFYAAPDDHGAVLVLMSLKADDASYAD